VANFILAGERSPLAPPFAYAHEYYNGISIVIQSDCMLVGNNKNILSEIRIHVRVLKNHCINTTITAAAVELYHRPKMIVFLNLNSLVKNLTILSRRSVQAVIIIVIGSFEYCTLYVLLILFRYNISMYVI